MRQRTQTTLRGRGFGIVAPQGAANVRKLALLASPALCAAETGVEKIAEQQGEGGRGLEAEHARNRGRFGSLRTGRTQGATSRPWLGLTPREDGTGGKVRLGTGQRDRASVPCRLYQYHY